MKKILTFLLLSSLATTTLLAAENNQINISYQNIPESKLIIDLGNISKLSKKEIANKMEKLTSSYIVNNKSSKCIVTVKAVADRKDLDNFKFEVSTKGSINEIKKAIKSFPETIYEMGKNANSK